MIIPIMKKWKFTLDKFSQGGLEGVEATDFDDRSWRILDLPHDWQIENNRDPDMDGGSSQGFHPRNETGWYRYHFNVPLEWRDKQVQVRFDGVQRFSTVYLNGTMLDGHPYGYVPFDVDLDGALKYGEENIMVVKVDNTKGDGDRWYSGAGIYRQVELMVTNKLYIPRDGVKVRTTRLDNDAAGIRISTEILNKTDTMAHGEIKGRIVPPFSGPAIEFILPINCGPGNNALAEMELEIKKPVRWDINSPALYGLYINLGEDETSLRFGLREARFNGEEGFSLNGRPVKLKGVNLHHDGGAVGAAVPLAIWKRRFAKLKECGANAIRCAHAPQAAEFYDLADEMGFLLIDELYDKWAPSSLYFQEFFDKWWERDLEAMIRRDYNHPSIIIWSVGNEIEFQFQEHFYEQLALMCEKTHSLDPQRPVSAALINPKESWPLEDRISALLRYADIVDVLMLNYQESYYAELKRSGLRKPIIGSEVGTYYRSKENQFSDFWPRSPWEDVIKNTFVAGSFIWAGINYLGECSGWPFRGSANSVLDSAGFEKIRTWYVSSRWKDEPFLKLAVFDEGEPYCGGKAYWAFPRMRRHWNYPFFSMLRHLAAITNCDLVKIYQNDDPVRISEPDRTGDGIAHFFLPYKAGILRAEGYRRGIKVIEDILHTTKRAAAVEIIVANEAAPENTVLAEIWLKDQYGEPWVLDNPLAEVRIAGDAELIALDNGDFSSTEPYTAGKRTFWNGHILAILRIGNSAGVVRLTVITEMMNTAWKDITISLGRNNE
jgi:beta-galactosidase